MKKTKRVKRLQIIREKRSTQSMPEKAIPLERPIILYLNERPLVTFMATPEKLEELAIGFLFSEGLIRGPREVRKVFKDEDRGIVWVDVDSNNKLFSTDFLKKRYITSGCGGGQSLGKILDLKNWKEIDSSLKISPTELKNLMVEMLHRAELYKTSGGIHCSALCDKKRVLSCSEDIGRHNTLDKILGECLLKKIDTKDKIILTTGRISSEMIAKAAAARASLVASRTAPTDLALEMAERLGVTVVGYLKKDQMNIYAHPEKISV